MRLEGLLAFEARGSFKLCVNYRCRPKRETIQVVVKAEIRHLHSNKISSQDRKLHQSHTLPHLVACLGAAKPAIARSEKHKIDQTVRDSADDSRLAHQAENRIVFTLALSSQFDAGKLLEVILAVLQEITVAKTKHGPLQEHAPTRMKNVDPIVHLFVSLAEQGGLISGELGCDAGKVHHYQQED